MIKVYLHMYLIRGRRQCYRVALIIYRSSNVNVLSLILTSELISARIQSRSIAVFKKIYTYIYIHFFLWHLFKELFDIYGKEQSRHHEWLLFLTNFRFKDLMCPWYLPANNKSYLNSDATNFSYKIFKSKQCM